MGWEQETHQSSAARRRWWRSQTQPEGGGHPKMNFFSRNVKTADARYELDQVIATAGRAADEAMVACLVESEAFWAAHDRKRATELDEKYPGYRAELNRRRTAAGLPTL